MPILPLLQRFDTMNLRLRLISASIMAPVALFAVYWGGIVFWAVITGAITIGLYEWLHLVAPQMNKKIIGVGCSLLVIGMAVGYFSTPLIGSIFALFSSFILFLLALRDQPDAAPSIAIGIPYMAGFGLAALALRFTPVSGQGLLFYLLAVVWSTDIGAYASGSAIGGAKLAPKISPKKTWAGLVGGMMAATIIGYATALLFDARHATVAFALSPVLAAVAQAGDLFESYMKRRANVKESGDLIPGHGGVLDRIDGLIFAGIALFLFQVLFGEQLSWW